MASTLCAEAFAIYAYRLVKLTTDLKEFASFVQKQNMYTLKKHLPKLAPFEARLMLILILNKVC